LLEKGQIRKTGTAEECIAEYVLKPAMADDAGNAGGCPVRLLELHVSTQQPVRSGEHASFRLVGEAGPGTNGRFDPYNIFVRSAQTGKVIYGVQGANIG